MARGRIPGPEKEYSMADKTIFVINPGSTSTKLALYKNGEQVFKTTAYLDKEFLGTPKLVDQVPKRLESIHKALEEHGVDPADFDMIACRGGNMPGVEGGVYAVGQHLVNTCTYAPFQEHASNIACILGYELARPYGTPVIINDGVGVDELDDIARFTGIPEIRIIPVNHVLNSRMVCRMTAEKLGKKYEDCTFIVCHMGGGTGLTLHKKGRLADCCASDMGPMSPERAGRIPTVRMAEFCYKSDLTLAQMRRYIKGGSGILAHLGTQDMMEVERRVSEGDEHAAEVVHAMAYQTARGIGELAAAAKGQVDRIIITGSLAYFKQFRQWVEEHVSFIAPIEVLPGEYEMEALSAAALRVLNGQEVAKTYDLVPYGYESMDAFYAAFPEAVRE